MERDYSRKEFFRVGVVRAAGGLLDLWKSAREGAIAAGTAALTRGREVAALADATDVTAVAWVRPPGALEERRFRERCTRCDDCVQACPHWVVRKAGPEFGARMQGTPVLIPSENPCPMCPDLPCAASCTTGALVVPEAGGFPAVGTARVDASLCYHAQGQPCDYCQKHCPLEPKAIRIPTGPGRPRVDAAACTGCGMCAQICPVAAIRIERPAT